MFAKILIIDPSQHISEILQDSLNSFSEAKFDTIVIHDIYCSKKVDFSKFDLILVHFSDYSTSDMIKEIRIRAEFIPILILANNIGTEVSIEIMKLGVKDLFFKEENTFEILPHRIKMCIEEVRVQKILAKRLRNKEETEVRLDTLKKTLATISHYIINSTTSISGYAQLCKMTPENDEISDLFINLAISESEKISIVLEEFERTIQKKKEFSTTEYVGIQNAIFDMNENIKNRYKLKNPN